MKYKSIFQHVILSISFFCLHACFDRVEIENMYLRSYADKEIDYKELVKRDSFQGFDNLVNKKVLFIVDANCSECVHRLDNWKEFQLRYLSKEQAFPSVLCIVQGGETALFKRYVLENPDLKILFYLDPDYNFVFYNNLYKVDRKIFFLGPTNKIAHISESLDAQSFKKVFETFFF
ncbi:hypothetical protein [Sphingobacterium sp. MYb382]|uniref:hypothetical protein n=1 Tax=Sphingobacterium sp. MYb382 TaxID=2745278 RepID=UPI00309D9777